VGNPFGFARGRVFAAPEKRLRSGLQLRSENGGGNVFKFSKTIVILRGMKSLKLLHLPRRRLIGVLIAVLFVMSAGIFYLYGQDKSQYPDGYDAVEAAPMAHKVLFENAFVRVLEIPTPPTGTMIPVHHHRWPSFFLTWDTGGKTSHIRFRKPDGSVQDVPSVTTPVHPGVYKVRWSEPEPMRSVEVVDNVGTAEASPDHPPLLRIEIKCHP
jgi:hypothetical protein